MRSQASKPLPKKGSLSKTTLKTSSATKQTSKKTPSPKKPKNLVSKVKVTKKPNSKDDPPTGKNDEDSKAGNKSETSIDTPKAGTSKSYTSRSDSPAKKKPKEKKDAIKTPSDVNVKKPTPKKAIPTIKARKAGVNKGGKDKDDIKYKINVDAVKNATSKFSKAKKIIKKSNGQKKKGGNQGSLSNETDEKEQAESNATNDKPISNKNEDNKKNLELKKEITTINDKKDEENLLDKSDFKNNTDDSSIITTPPKTSISQPETPKSETERPPKFFTSSRSPRMVDIDVKCCKNSKGNLSVSERFLSMKFETKTDDGIKDNNPPNTLVAQGPEIDVYTFTEKVDSPKSILSDFRNPVNKTVGRVRPIARVKGTVIDKKTESEKKKYSPHRPIEEVVKLLKANKRSEELNTTPTQSHCTVSSVESTVTSDEKEVEENPKPIVSKSYKMVARKSSITGKPFSPIKFLDQDHVSQNKSDKPVKTISPSKKATARNKKQQKKDSVSEDDFENAKFAINTKSAHYTSSDDSVNESNDDNDNKESSESDTPKTKKVKNKKYKRITDSVKKSTSKELKELSKDSLVDLKDETILGGDKPSKRRLKLLSMWSGPKKHRMASLNALAKVHCLYENESRTHMELGLMKTIDRQIMPGTSKQSTTKKKELKLKEVEKETTSESEYENKKEKKDESSESSDDNPPQRSLRGVPGIRSAGKYWDPKSSTSSSEDSEIETKKKTVSPEKKKVLPKSSSSSGKSDSDKPPAKMKKTAGVAVKKKRNRNEVVMDLKDMVVQKRMASLNATAILAASYEKRSSKSSKDETTSDSGSDESFTQKPKNGASSGVKSELKNEDTKKESDESAMTDRKQKVEVIVNQDTDVTITGVYSTHLHEGFCTVSGMQYRISSTSHTQTTATANCEKEGCPRDESARYTPLTALSSMQPPAEHAHTHPHPVPELGGLARRPGCSSAFSAPSPSAHHEPGYYQPAGPLIKESNAEAERALARYHPPPHYHAPHPPVLQQYGPAYYPDLCYGRYYRPPGPYHMPPPQPDAPMVGVGSEPYPPPQYYGTPPCYQHSPQRIPYVEYRGCSCPLNACPKNVHIGPVTGKAPAGGGPADVTSAHAPPGGAFRSKVRACALEAVADTHGSGKDPPLEPEPPAAANAPHPCTMPTIGGASPKRELYDIRDNMRRKSDIPGPAEPIGPPSPARGSAGACAPQPPPIAPRRARLGKAMARRSLAGDDTGLLLCVPQPPMAHHSDADDDVMAISPPLCAPIDLSSSDERSTPLVDVKKENEGPTYASSRKTDAQALREHNCTTLSETAVVADAAKAVKRRYSKPKLEIDMKDTQLEDSCKTNGIGEHVKLQKRRKVSSDQTDIPRTETVTVTKESKRKNTQTKRAPKTPSSEKKSTKRKIEGASTGPRPKKNLLESSSDEDIRLKSVPAVVEELPITKPKTKSALLLDKLIRKNSIDRADSKGYASDKELNPAELFLTPNENVAQNGAKKTLNINNNVVENTGSVNGVRPNTIAAVNQLIGKKLAYKNACKIEKVDSKVTNGLKTVLKTPTAKSCIKDDRKVTKCALSVKNSTNVSTDKSVKKAIETITTKSETLKEKCETIKEKCETVKEKCETVKEKSVTVKDKCETVKDKSDINTNTSEIKDKTDDTESSKVKAIKVSKADIVPQSSEESGKESQKSDVEVDRPAEPEPAQLERSPVKRRKLANGQAKRKRAEKVVKLLVSKRPAIKTDEATLVVEEACASPSPGPSSVRRARRRTGGPGRRARRLIPPPSPPCLDSRSTPRWSNGWNWDGEHYLSKVYLNNDSRLDRTARCWLRMTHKSGDRVARGDCVLLRPNVARAQPFVARVASLWENPEDGEMMVSLVWYYRPEHTDRGRQPTDAPDEVFASRHRDANSVACIEDKCYVLTFNEYCRYRKRLKAAEEGIKFTPSIVPPLPASDVNPAFIPNDSKIPPSVSPELVMFCRKIYDFRSKKIHVPNK